MSDEGKVVLWKEKLAEKVKAQQQQEKAQGGQFISIKSGVMSYGGLPVQGNKADMIVLESIFENAYYPDKYGTTDNTSPACYSFSSDGVDMAPHPDAEHPQSKTCKTCKMNEFGTADSGRGKGKACANRRRLAVISAAAVTSAAEVSAAPTAYFRVPPTSTRYWSSYVQNLLAKTDMPFFASITSVGVVPDAKTQLRCVFSHVAEITDDELLEALYRRAAAESTLIDFPYPKSATEEPAKAPAAATKKGKM
jgi:hypothetical protein